jgi:hypothetical protein
VGPSAPAFSTRPALQCGFQLPNRRVPRPTDGIERQARARLAAISSHVSASLDGSRHPSKTASQRVRSARWRGFVLIAQLLFGQLPDFPIFGSACLLLKLIRSRSLVCSVRALDCSRLEHGPAVVGTREQDRAGPAWRSDLLWTLIIPRLSTMGGLVYGRVWRRHDGRRWEYRAITEYEDDR